MTADMRRPIALVVDDDLSYRLFIRQFLELAGLTVIIESNGRLALRRLAEQPVAVLVTDLVMPEIEGLELIEIVRRGFPDMRIVAISGDGPRGDGGYLRVARLFGADATLQTPFSGSELIEAVLPQPAAE
ncbi:MAG: response regulator [Stellaceae bacterium]